jgi:hypothetical protein
MKKGGSDHGAVMGLEDLEAAIEWQAEHAEINRAPCTARIIRALIPVSKGDTATGRRIATWHGLSLKDAMPLRLAGGLHHLLLSGEDDQLARVYSGQISDQGQVDRLVCELVETYDHLLLPWLDGPPQTNEAGRSASIMAGMLWLTQHVQPRFELFELGASAGILTMLDRYHFTLGDTQVGPASSPMRIEPEWRSEHGAPPAPPEEFAILSVRGCDIAPIDLSDEEEALKLKAYVWPDAPARMARIEAAIALASEQKPELVKQDAAAFIFDAFDRPHADRTTRAMFHSIMWQYMPTVTQDTITARIEDEGSRASPEKPVAWLALETDPETFRHELKVRYWNGGPDDGATFLLSHAHPHGAWIEWSVAQ